MRTKFQFFLLTLFCFSSTNIFIANTSTPKPIKKSVKQEKKEEANQKTNVKSKEEKIEGLAKAQISSKDMGTTSKIQDKNHTVLLSRLSGVPAEVKERITKIFFFALIEALSYKRNNRSFFNSDETPEKIKEDFANKLGEISIKIDSMEIYGILSEVSGKTAALHISFDTIVSYLLNILLTTEDKWPENLEDMLRGKMSVAEHRKVLVECDTLASQFLFRKITSNALIFLAKNDFTKGLEVFEKDYLKMVNEAGQKDLKFLLELNFYLDFLISRDPTFTAKAEEAMNTIIIIKSPDLSTLSQQVNTFNNIEPETGYSSDNIMSLASYLKLTSESVELKDLPREAVQNYYNWLENSDNEKQHFFVYKDDKNKKSIIIPRKNPINDWKSGVIADKWTKTEDARIEAEKILAEKIIDDHVLYVLSDNPKTIISLKTRFNRDLPEQNLQIHLGDFVKRLKLYSISSQKGQKANSIDKFFLALMKIFKYAFIEAASIIQSRKSTLSQVGSDTIDLNKSYITIDPMNIRGLIEVTKKDKSEVTSILFNDVLNFLLDSIDSKTFLMIEGLDLIKSNNGQDGKKTEFLNNTLEALMKAFLLKWIKQIVITNLLRIEAEKTISDKQMEVFNELKTVLSYGKIYLERLMHEKRKELMSDVELQRANVYCLIIGCNNTPVKEANMAIIENAIGSINNSFQIDHLRDRIKDKKLNMEFKKISIAYLPNEISAGYEIFIKEQEQIASENPKDSRLKNFYVGVFKNFETLKSGLEFSIYIIPKYDLRNNGLAGAYIEQPDNVETTLLYQRFINKQIESLLQDNKSGSVSISDIPYDITKKDLGLSGSIRNTRCLLDTFIVAINLQDAHRRVLGITKKHSREGEK